MGKINRWDAENEHIDSTGEFVVYEDHITALQNMKERCAQVVEQFLSVDSGDPARWTDPMVVKITQCVRALGEDDG